MSDQTRTNWVARFLRIVERGGNALPHPATLFLLLAILVMFFSWLFTAIGASATHPTSGEIIVPRNLLTGEGLHYMMTTMVTNFTGFAPLGTVLVAMLGIGVAESSGLIGTSLRMLVTRAPSSMLTFIIVFAGVLSNMASEVGYVLLVPLGAIVFHAAGRNPIAGLAAAFAGVSGGYSANLFLGTVDPLLAGISEEAARIVDPGYSVNATANWYFMIGSTPLIAFLGTFVTERIVVPLLGEYKGDAVVEEVHDLTPVEKKGLGATLFATMVFLMLCFVSIMPWEGALNANSSLGERGWLIFKLVTIALFGITGLIMTLRRSKMNAILLALTVVYALFAFHVIPGNGFMRDPSGALLGSPFLKGIVALIFLSGAILGIVYGIVTKRFKNDADVMNGMGKTIETLGIYIVLVFFAAQFVEYFKWSNMGQITAISGAEALEPFKDNWGLLMVAFILVAAMMNMFMGSASAKWALMAPVFIPMFMYLGYSPEFTQVAYRVGDSVTNIISPCMSYFALIVAFMQKYDKKASIGTVIATMLPYSVIFLLAWIVFFFGWILFGVPLGPSGGVFYP